MSNMETGTQQVSFPCHVNCFFCHSQPWSKHSKKPPHILRAFSPGGNAVCT